MNNLKSADVSEFGVRPSPGNPRKASHYEHSNKTKARSRISNRAMQRQNSFVLPPNLGRQGLLQISTPTVEKSAAAAAVINVAFDRLDLKADQPAVARWVSRIRHFSSAANRRSRCGPVRGSPVLSSHFSPGFAPHVGQRTASTSFGLTFIVRQCTLARQQDGQL